METHKIDIAGHVTTIQTPDGFGQMLVDAMSDAFGYEATIPDPNNAESTIDNPQSPEQFAAVQIVTFCRQVTAAYHVKQSRKAAEATANAQNDAYRDQISIN